MSCRIGMIIGILVGVGGVKGAGAHVIRAGMAFPG
jgi:hypothetical protein